MRIAYYNNKYGHLLKCCPHCGHDCKFEDGGFGMMRVTCSNYESCVKNNRQEPKDFKKLIEQHNKRSEEE